MALPGRPRIDRTEGRMIEILQQNGRKTTRQLAKEAGVSELTARRKLRRLIDQDIIRVVATVDPFDVGYETPAIIGLRVDPSRLEEVATAISELPNVVAATYTTFGSSEIAVATSSSRDGSTRSPMMAGVS